MTRVLHLHHYRATADQITAADRIAEAVSAARAILRGAARHDDAALTEACRVLQTWGDQIDYLEADAMLLALRLRHKRLTDEAAEVLAEVIRRDWMRLIGGALVAVAVTWFALVVVLAW